jgi:pyruvate/2-oxoglutarate dehydrogenase complex dihydrolipoamide acyltransferase (E2) component
MTTSVVLPKWGMGIEEGTITKWMKAVGDHIDEGEFIAEVETAKATQEVEAPVGGILVKILVDEGQSAEVNTVIAVIEEDHG